MEMTETGLVPAPEADLILGVKRLGSILSAGTDNTFATDEAGVATAIFERSELPGDKNGGLILVAKLDDHELYGTLIAEIPARWGTPLTVNESATNKRALWGSRKISAFCLQLRGF